MKKNRFFFGNFLKVFFRSFKKSNKKNNKKIMNRNFSYNSNVSYVLGVQLCFRRFPIDGFSGK